MNTESITTSLSMNDAIAQAAYLGLTAEALKAHAMRPANVTGARSFHGLGPAASQPKIPVPRPEHTYTFDGGGFCAQLHNRLKSSAAGYIMRMRQNGKEIYSLDWNWAVEPQDGGVGWQPTVRMNIASCSKLVTAIAMTKLLDDRGLSFDTKIAGYLPSYWAKGPGVDRVTFADLLTHRSGFHWNQDESPSDYVFMKQQVAAGTTHVGQWNYQNMNFGLCRILLATVNGNLPVSLHAAEPVIDQIWDLKTLDCYKAYVTANVFGPGRVYNGSLAHQNGDALAYDFPVSEPGWNSGNLTEQAGGNGWHLTVNDLLGIMGAFRRAGSIVSSTQAQSMLDAGYGLDLIWSTPLGTMYAKNGGWGGAQFEQSTAFFLPQGIELAVFVNSPIAGAHNDLMWEIVSSCYVDNVK